MIDPGDPEFKRFMALREALWQQTLRSLATSVSFGGDFALGSVVNRQRPEEQQQRAQEEKNYRSMRSFDELVGAADFYGIQNPSSMDPEELEQAVTVRRGLMQRDDGEIVSLKRALFEGAQTGIGLAGVATWQESLRAVNNLVGHVPFIGDAIARSETMRDADRWLSMLEEGLVAELPQAQRERVTGVAGAIGMFPAASIAWEAMGVAGALPRVARIGAKVSPIGRALVKGAASAAIIQDPSAPLYERAVNTGLGAAMGLGTVGGALGRTVSGAGLGLIAGSMADSDDPLVPLISAVTGAAAFGLGGTMLSKVKRSFPSNFQEGDWYFEQPLALGSGGAPELPPGMQDGLPAGQYNMPGVRLMGPSVRYAGPITTQGAAAEATALSKQASVMESPALAELQNRTTLDDADLAQAVVASYPSQVGVLRNVGDVDKTLRKILQEQMPRGVGPQDYRVVRRPGRPVFPTEGSPLEEMSLGQALENIETHRVPLPSQYTDILISSGRPITNQMVKDYEQYGLVAGHRAQLPSGQEIVVQELRPNGTALVKSQHGCTLARVDISELLPLKTSHVVDDFPGLYTDFASYAENRLLDQSARSGVQPVTLFSNEGQTQAALLMEEYIGGQGVDPAGYMGVALRNSLEQRHIEALRGLALPEEQVMLRDLQSEFTAVAEVRPSVPATLEQKAVARGMQLRRAEAQEQGAQAFRETLTGIENQRTQDVLALGRPLSQPSPEEQWFRERYAMEPAPRQGGMIEVDNDAAQRQALYNRILAVDDAEEGLFSDFENAFALKGDVIDQLAPSEISGALAALDAGVPLEQLIPTLEMGLQATRPKGITLYGADGTPFEMDSPQAAEEFLRNYEVELLDDSPVTGFPLEVMETPPGYSETSGPIPGEFRDADHYAEEVHQVLDEAELGLDEDVTLPLDDDGPPLMLPPGPPPGRSFTSGEERDYFRSLERLDNFWSRMFTPTRHMAMRIDSALSRFGFPQITGAVNRLGDARNQMVNAARYWEKPAQDFSRVIRKRLRRDGTLTNILFSPKQYQEGMMTTASLTEEEKVAFRNIRNLFEGHTNSVARFIDPSIPDDFIQVVARFEESLPGDPRGLPVKPRFGVAPEERGQHFIEGDLDAFISRYFRSAAKVQYMAQPYEEIMGLVGRRPDRAPSTLARFDETGQLPEVVKSWMRDWANDTMWGIDPSKDIILGSTHTLLNGISRRVGVNISKKEILGAFNWNMGTAYAAILGDIDSFIRDVPQAMVGISHVGFDKGMPVLKRLMNDKAYLNGMREMGYARGWLVKEHGLAVDPDVFGGTTFRDVNPIREPSLTQREGVARAGDIMHDRVLRPLGLDQGWQGAKISPLRAYGAQSDWSRLWGAATGYETAASAIREYRLSRPSQFPSTAALHRKLLEDSRVIRFQGPIQDEFMRLVSLGDDEGAANFFARQLADKQTRHGMSEQPETWRKLGPLTGRISMRWMTYSSQMLSELSQIIADPRIPTSSKASYLTQLAAFQTAAGVTQHLTGWNLMRMGALGVIGSFAGSSILDPINSLQRVLAYVKSLNPAAGSLDPTENALLRTAGTGFGMSPFNLNPGQNTANPYAPYFRTIQGVFENMEWGPEAVTRGLVTGQYGDPSIERWENRGAGPLAAPDYNVFGVTPPMGQNYVAPQGPPLAGGGAF